MGWSLEIQEPDYLDGIKSGFTIRDGGGAPIAYAFDADKARLMSMSMGLLDALDNLYHKTVVGTKDERHEALNAAWVLIYELRGNPQSGAVGTQARSAEVNQKDSQ